MRKPLTVWTVIATAAALSAGVAFAQPGVRTVKVGDNWFYKKTNGVPKITVKRNTTVRFKFIGDDPHDVWGYRAGKKLFGSPIKSSGYYKKKMTKTGTINIVCNIHGAADQSMKIVVKK